MAITTSVRAKKTVNEVFGAKEVQWGPIGKEVYLRTYSRLKPDGTQETWQDTVLRVVDGNLALVNRKFHEPGEREKLLELIYSMDMIPAGRHLWVSGVPGRAFLYNCHSAGFSRKDFTAHFTFTFEELMKGGGVGSNYSNKYIEMYPPVFSKVNLHIVCNPDHPNVGEFKGLLSKEFDHYTQDRFVVDDSREGWAATLQEVLLAAWHGKDSALVVDVSMLRERGALLKSFGGRSSGPGPLVIMLKSIADLLSAKVGKKLTSIDMMQIDHELATCVVSGNIRRSARMSIKHWADPDIIDFVKCKHNHEQHWSTNISVEVDEKYFQALRRGEERAKAVLKEVAKGMHKNGEPGFWNSSFAANGEVEYPFTTNPCGEISFEQFENCLTGDAKILTSRGYKRIDEMVGQDVAVVSQFGDEDLKSKGGIFEARVFESRTQPVKVIHTVDGREVKASLDHPFLVQTAFEKYEWRKVKDLRVGDMLVANTQAMAERPLGFSKKYYALGHFLGDGWFHHKGASLSIGICAGGEDVWLVDELRPVWQELIHEASEFVEGARDEAYRTSVPEPKFDHNGVRTLTMYKPTIARLLERRYGFKSGTAHGKRIPEVYWSWSAMEKASFLRGLYDADGTIHDGAREVVGLTCANPELGRDLTLALSEFGIVARMCVIRLKERGNRVQCMVSVRGRDNMKKFASTIYGAKAGFLKRKAEKLSSVLSKERERKTVTGRVALAIAFIEDGGTQKTYNLEVEGSRNFVANGFVTHNCNLGHINLERFAGNADGAREAFRLMSRFLVRATFGDVLNPYQKAVQDRNRRIGVGFFGFHPWLVYQGVTFSGSHHNKEVRNLLKSFKMACRDEARRYAFQLRIPEPIKVTTIAPTGTISLLPGTTSGCQPIFARYYKRLVNYSSDDSNLPELAAKGYPIEDSLYTPKTKVVTFFCKDPLVAECEKRGIDLALIEDQHEIEVSDHLAVQAMLQDEYADNSISYTINFRDHDVKVEDIELALKVHLPHLKGTTLMPENDSRPQTPFQRISHAQFEDAERKGIGKVSDKEMECLNGVCPVK